MSKLLEKIKNNFFKISKIDKVFLRLIKKKLKTIM